MTPTTRSRRDNRGCHPRLESGSCRRPLNSASAACHTILAVTVAPAGTRGAVDVHAEEFVRSYVQKGRYQSANSSHLNTSGYQFRWPGSFREALTRKFAGYPRRTLHWAIRSWPRRRRTRQPQGSRRSDNSTDPPTGGQWIFVNSSHCAQIGTIWRATITRRTPRCRPNLPNSGRCTSAVLCIGQHDHSLPIIRPRGI